MCAGWTVCVNVFHVCDCKQAHILVSPPQQKHKEDGTEQNREGAHSGDNNLSYHLHVAGQRVCKAHAQILLQSVLCSLDTAFEANNAQAQHSKG